MKKKRNRLFARVLSFAILSVFLAGCGGNSGNSVKGNDSAQSAEPMICRHWGLIRVCVLIALFYRY